MTEMRVRVTVWERDVIVAFAWLADLIVQGRHCAHTQLHLGLGCIAAPLRKGRLQRWIGLLVWWRR